MSIRVLHSLDIPVVRLLVSDSGGERAETEISPWTINLRILYNILCSEGPCGNTSDSYRLRNLIVHAPTRANDRNRDGGGGAVGTGRSNHLKRIYLDILPISQWTLKTFGCFPKGLIP